MAKIDDPVADLFEEVDDSQESTSSTSNQAVSSEDIRKGFQDITGNLQAQTQLTSLLQDPDVAKLIAAKQQGKPVQVQEALDEEQEEQPSEPVDWEAFKDNPQGLANHVVSKMSVGMVKAVKDILKTEREEANKKFDAIFKTITNYQKKEVATQFSALIEKYPDAKALEQDMVEVRNENPGLKLEELYIIAKARRGSPLVPANRTETERPTAPADRQPRAKKKFSNARNEFSSAMDDALDEFDWEAVLR